jgi:hypothetical protein
MKQKLHIPPQGIAAIVASVESRWNVTLAPARMIRHANP